MGQGAGARVLRSLMLGDCDFYFSPYIFGVNQAMSRLGHWHSQINIRSGIDVIDQRIRDVKPNVLWTHMLLWAPPGSPTVDRLIAIMEREAKRGCKVIIHDGDYKAPTRHARDISSWCAVALCNHKFDRAAWKVPVLYWPYFAFAQDEIVPPSMPHLDGKLFFAGTIDMGNVYAERTKLLSELREILVTPTDGNTLLQTAEIASSATAVLGFGRPGDSAWSDTRVYQYPGAGGILIHDDAPQLEPTRHFVPYTSGSAASVAEAFRRVVDIGEEGRRQMRREAFTFVQEHHSSVARVRQVLDFLFGSGGST